MPSKARIAARDYMLPEIEKIISSHKSLRKGQRGPDTHRSILRAGVLFLCATWEVYCEDVVREVAKKLLNQFDDPLKLPGDMQNQLKAAVHHESMVKSTPLRLAGTGWRDVYFQEVDSACGRFNTPKSDKLNDLFKKWVGCKNISSYWSLGAPEIDRFVTLRGEIAHKGSEAAVVSREELVHFKAVVSKTINETDDALYGYLRQPSLLGFAPWQKTSKS